MVIAAHRQSAYDVRFDWGVTGAEVIAHDADVAVVVDVLSFTTTLSVAADLGVVVYPYRWDLDSASAFAADRDAVLAVGRSRALPGDVSLSPATLRSTAPPARLVLPSPNGSTIAFALASSPRLRVLGASLRNAAAVASWLDRHAAGPVAVIAAGERWPDGSLRPSVEDVWGAGAVVAHLAAKRSTSPEARNAAAAWRSVAPNVSLALRDCASGRELADLGYPQDVTIAAEVNLSGAVPVLEGERFVNRA